MGSVGTRRKTLKMLVLVAILLTAIILSATSIQIQNLNRNPLIYQGLFPYVNSPTNQPLTVKTITWDNKTVTGTESYSNMDIILNGNLTIASGGSLTLTSVTLRVSCTADGSNRIEVQNGGKLYINDTDGNPDTRNDATNITALDPSCRFLFWVQSGATFQMNNSELHYCGYDETPPGNYDHWGLWINTNSTIIEKNTLTNNYCGIILYDAHHNTIRNNTAASNNLDGFFLMYSSNNNLSGNTATNNTYNYGFQLGYSSYNNLLSNNANRNGLGYGFGDCSDNNLSGNTATNNTYEGFRLTFSSNNTLTGNTATNNTYGFYLWSSSNNNTLTSNAANNNGLGFYLDSGSNNNTLTGNTAANNTYDGFHLYSSWYDDITDNTAINNRYGFYLEKSSSNILCMNEAVNSTIQAYYLDGDSTGNDLTGRIIANYLRVEVLDYYGGSVQGADVKVEVDGGTVYASPGFGGSNSTTDENGLTGWIPVAFQTYLSGSTVVENEARVTVSYGGLAVIDNPRITNMSTSHTETFIVSNITSHTPQDDLLLRLLSLFFAARLQSSFSSPIIDVRVILMVVLFVTVLAVALWRLHGRSPRGKIRHYDKYDIDEYGEIRRKHE